MPKQMIGEHQRHHGFGDGDAADGDAGVVAAAGGDFRRFVRDRHRLLQGNSGLYLAGLSVPVPGHHPILLLAFVLR